MHQKSLHEQSANAVQKVLSQQGQAPKGSFWKGEALEETTVMKN